MAAENAEDVVVGDIYKCGLGRLFMVVRNVGGSGTSILCIKGPGKFGECDTPGFLYSGPPASFWQKVGHFDGV